ncbi:MAG: plastocyanin/azurin family copper-binding protein [Chloroflexota bacterium]
MSRKSVLFYFLLLAIMLTAVACGGQPEAATPVPTAAATEPPTAEPPTAEPPEPPTAEPLPEPTEAATAEPLPEPTPAPQRVGILRFSDSESVRAGNYSLIVEGVAPLAAGQHYELWLVADDGQTMLDLGALIVDGDAITANDSTEENLIGRYSSALISIEPDNDSDAGISTEIAYTGLVPLESLLHVRNVVFAFAGNPGGKGYLIGAEEQARLAIDHANLLQEALTAGDLVLAQRHAEHVVNILDGETGSSFGDLDGDGQAQNPGDGFGVRAYLAGAKAEAEGPNMATATTDEVKLHAGHIVAGCDNALAWLDEAIAEAQHVLAADSVAEAQPFAETLIQLTLDMVNGRDVNNDGYAAPAAGEGAILTAYEHGVFTGGFEIFAGAATGQAGETVTEPAATETAPQEVVVEMLDFTYSELDLVIPVGTTVKWINAGQFEHSATASDGSFDTGLYPAGGEASITFDTPGTFLYYCLLHGTPDGGGMAATLTVEGDAGPLPTAPPAPTEAPTAEPAPAPVTVNMLDFTYDPLQLTVPAGTTVTWVNAGQFEHSATADDGSFDTGLFAAGGQASVTFTTPGTFAYYCILHGTAGGVGMAATITVEGP